MAQYRDRRYSFTKGRFVIINDKNIVGPWVARKVNVFFHPEHCEAIGLEKNGRIVAGVIYEGWNGVSCVCHIASEGRMTAVFLAAIFDYPFVHGGLKKIMAVIPSGNDKSISLVSKMGFRKECQILDVHPDGSLLIYTMSKEQCRFIGERYGHKLSADGQQRSSAGCASAAASS